jgi:hypothetical protein
MKIWCEFHKSRAFGPVRLQAHRITFNTGGGEYYVLRLVDGESNYMSSRSTYNGNFWDALLLSLIMGANEVSIG